MPPPLTPAPPDQTATSPIVRAVGLTKKFGDEVAVDNVTFQIPRGAIFGFIGPSGCGKTTTVRLLTGLYTPTSGQVTVLDRTPTEFTQSVRERIGYLPQLFVLYPDLTVWENLNFAASLYGMGWRRSKHLHRLLAFVELDEHRDKRANQISGGMQRRLSLAATLVHDPELIFLDEPTAGIDPMLRRKLWDHFRTLQDQGRTLFITTQYVSEAAYCDWVGVMAEGRLLTVATPDELRKQAYGGEVIDLSVSEPIGYAQHIQPLRELACIQDGRVHRTGEHSLRLIVDEASTAMPLVMQWCQNHDVTIDTIEEHLPPFDDVFVELVERHTT